MTARPGAAAGVGHSYSEIRAQGYKVSVPSLSVSATYSSIWGMLPFIDSFVFHPFIWLSTLNKVIMPVMTGLQGQSWQNQLVISIFGLCTVMSLRLFLSLPVFPPSLSFYLLLWPWDFLFGGKISQWWFTINVTWCLLSQDCLLALLVSRRRKKKKRGQKG